jgi:hypothetical protein
VKRDLGNIPLQHVSALNDLVDKELEESQAAELGEDGGKVFDNGQIPESCLRDVGHSVLLLKRHITHKSGCLSSVMQNRRMGRDSSDDELERGFMVWRKALICETAESVQCGKAVPIRAAARYRNGSGRGFAGRVSGSKALTGRDGRQDGCYSCNDGYSIHLAILPRFH